MGKDADGCCETCKLFGDGPPPLDSSEPAPVLSAPHDRLKVVIARGGQTIAEIYPDKERIWAGRVSGNEIVLKDGTISRRQFRLAFEQSGVTVTDGNSACGTFVNGHKTTGPTLVREGATIHAGDFTVRIVPRD